MADVRKKALENIMKAQDWEAKGLLLQTTLQSQGTVIAMFDWTFRRAHCFVDCMHSSCYTGCNRDIFQLKHNLIKLPQHEFYLHVRHLSLIYKLSSLIKIVNLTTIMACEAQKKGTLPLLLLFYQGEQLPLATWKANRRLSWCQHQLCAILHPWLIDRTST